MAAATPVARSIAEMETRVKVMVVAGTLLGMFTAAMNQTVVSTALPRIVGSLGNFDLLPWVFTSFMLTSTTVVPIVGKLTDIYGRKPFYMGGIVILVLGSVLAGSSQNMAQLVVYRAVQGLGAGCIMGIAFALIGDVFPPRERARWSGIMASVWALASILGPLIGGAITDHGDWLTSHAGLGPLIGDDHWRWVFYVNLPLGLVSLAVLGVGMPAIRPAAGARLDYRGIPLLLATVIPLLLAFSWAGSEYAWTSPQILGLFAASGVALVLFFVAETRTEEPLLPLSLFGNPIFAVAAAVTLLSGMGMFGAISYIPTFVQGVVGSSATNSGLVTMPLTIAMSIASTLAGQIIYRVGRYRWLGVAGLAVMAFGMFLFSRLNVDSTNFMITRNMVILGVGLGVSVPLYMLAVQNAVPYRLMGVATSTIQFMRSVGGTIGVALIGSIINARVVEHLAVSTPPEVKEEVPANLLRPMQDPQILLSPAGLAGVRDGFLALGDRGSDLFLAAQTALRSALAESIAESFLLGLVVTLLAVVISVFLKELPLRRDQFMAQEQMPQAPADAQPMTAPIPAVSGGANGPITGSVGAEIPSQRRRGPNRRAWRLAFLVLTLGVGALLAFIALRNNRHNVDKG